jgi:hypothetical protein
MKDMCVFPERIARGIASMDPEGLLPKEFLEQPAASLSEASFQPLEEMNSFGLSADAAKPIKKTSDERTFAPILGCLRGHAGFAHLFFDS